MFVYWLMFLIPAISVFGRADFSLDRAKVFWVLTIIAFAVFVGLRDWVGGDWYNYLQHYNRAKNYGVDDALAIGDPGYYVLNWYLAKQDYPIHTINAICGGIVMLGVSVFARKQPMPWVSLAVAVPYMLVVVAMGYTRQSAALGFIFIALACLGEQRVKWFVLFVVAGALFHKSALLLLPIAALASSRNRVWTTLWVGVTGAVATNFLLLESADTLWENYVQAQYSSQGGLIRVVMNAVPAAALLFFRDKLYLTEEQRSLWFWMSIFALVCIPLVMISSTAVDRMALYFIPLQLFVFSRLPLLANTEKDIHTFSLAIIGYYALVLFVWLNFAANAQYWLPYRNTIWTTDETSLGPQEMLFPLENLPFPLPRH